MLNIVPSMIQGCVTVFKRFQCIPLFVLIIRFHAQNIIDSGTIRPTNLILIIGCCSKNQQTPDLTWECLQIDCWSKLKIKVVATCKQYASKSFVQCEMCVYLFQSSKKLSRNKHQKKKCVRICQVIEGR